MTKTSVAGSASVSSILMRSEAVMESVVELVKMASELQYLVKSVRAEATPKMTPPAEILCKSHAIDSRASKISEATYRYII